MLKRVSRLPLTRSTRRLISVSRVLCRAAQLQACYTRAADSFSVPVVSTSSFSGAKPQSTHRTSFLSLYFALAAALHITNITLDMYQYKKVPGEEEGSKRSYTEPAPASRRWKHRAWVWIPHIMFFTISCSVLLSGVRLRREASSQCHDKDFLPMWSPVLEAVADTCRMDRFDGSFATLNSYKGTPNPHIDEAWDCVLMANGGMISIDEETLHKVNASNEFSGKLPSDMGGGYMASVEVLRQLHCLNVLRQATYEDYYKDKAEPWEEADTGVLTYVWVKDHPAPSPDFNVQHKCRNIESILDWVEERQIHTKEGHRIERQPGQKELEPPP